MPQSLSRLFRSAVVRSVAGAILVFGLIQLVPYRITNPAVTQEPSWDRARTRELAVAACFNCHSNETHTYTWERIAPLSWWITSHVKGGRGALNFSECTRGRGEREASRTVGNGSMPPNYYTWLGLHGGANLTSAERQELAAGLDATLSGWRCGSGDD